MYIHIYIYIYISISISVSISTYVYLYTCDICEKFLYDENRQAVTHAGVSAAAIRPTETPCGISSHVVDSSQFRGPGLRTPTVWLGLGLIENTDWSGYLLIPMWTLQQLVLRSMTEAYPKC